MTLTVLPCALFILSSEPPTMTNLKSIDSGLVMGRGFRPRCGFLLRAAVLTAGLIWSSTFGGNAEVRARGTSTTAILGFTWNPGDLEAKTSPLGVIGESGSGRQPARSLDGPGIYRIELHRQVRTGIGQPITIDPSMSPVLNIVAPGGIGGEISPPTAFKALFIHPFYPPMRTIAY